MERTEFELFGVSMNAGRAWVYTAVLGLFALVGSVLAFPRQVYDGFIWRYFWGPVYADANYGVCAVKEGGTVRVLGDSGTCAQAKSAGMIVAEPGYTLVSEAGYAITLIFMLVGVLLLVRRLGIGRDRSLFYALVPFMFFGGALRVVEDAANAAFESGAGMVIDYPLNSLFISPVIYFTVFVVTLAALLGTFFLYRRGIIERYATLLAGIGAVVCVLTVGYIAYLVFGVIGSANQSAGFYPQFTLLTVVLSLVFTGGIYLALDRSLPWVNEGTGYMGLVVLFAHALDGVANVLAADWATHLGLPFTYSAKHPINQIIIDITKGVLPPSLVDTIGSAWPFLLVKLIAAVAVIALFDKRIFEENTRYALLLLVAIVAVGLGPGTRDMLRATFGI